MLDKAPNGKVSDLLNALDKALSAGDVERAVDLFQAGLLLARPRDLHLEHQDHGGQGSGSRHAQGALADTKPSNWKIADGEDASEADGITESWIQFETEVARGFRPHSPEGRPDLDAADDHERTQGPRRTAWLRPSDGSQTRRRTQSKNMEGRARSGSCRTRLFAPALLRHRRRRSGRHRARRPAAPAQCADDHRRKKRKARR